MRHALAAELLKLRTTRTAWGFLIATVLLTLLFQALTFAYLEPESTGDLREAFAGADALSTLLLIYGIVGTTGEHRHGTITTSLLAEPDRLTFLGAKLLAHFVTGVLLGLAAMGLTIAMGLIWLPARDITVDLSSSDWLGLVLGGVAAAGLSAAIGVAIGAIVRNQVAAVVGVLVYLFMIEPALSLIPGDVSRYAIGAASTALSGGAGIDDDQIRQGVAALVLVGWTLLLGAIGVFVAERRDVT